MGAQISLQRWQPVAHSTFPVRRAEPLGGCPHGRGKWLSQSNRAITCQCRCGTMLPRAAMLTLVGPGAGARPAPPRSPRPCSAPDPRPRGQKIRQRAHSTPPGRRPESPPVGTDHAQPRAAPHQRTTVFGAQRAGRARSAAIRRAPARYRPGWHGARIRASSSRPGSRGPFRSRCNRLRAGRFQVVLVAVQALQAAGAAGQILTFSFSPTAPLARSRASPCGFLLPAEAHLGGHIGPGHAQGADSPQQRSLLSTCRPPAPSPVWNRVPLLHRVVAGLVVQVGALALAG